jgi:hypothetical protein
MSYMTDLVFHFTQKIFDSETIAPALMQAWQHWRGQTPQSIQIHPNLTYYRPFDQCRIVADVTVILDRDTAPIELQLFFHVFADATQVKQQVEQGYALAVPPNAALPVFAIEDWQTVVWTLPHAPCLTELNDLLQPEYFCPLLIAPQDLPTQVTAYPAPQIFRYVPFKRAILTWENQQATARYFVKLCTEAEFLQVVDRFQRVYDCSAHLSFVVPEPVTADPISRTFAMRAVAGEQFTQIMRRLAPQPFEQLGYILAELHHTDLISDRIWTPDQELQTFKKAMAEVKLALPHLQSSLDRTIVQLTEQAQQIQFPCNYPIHANLFGDQILYDHEGFGIVDWDTLSMGDPHYDLGRLIAHLIYLAGREQLPIQAVNRCIKALITGYEGAMIGKLDRACLNWHITMQLLLRGKISSLRKLPENWPAHLEFVVAEAEWLLAGCSEFIQLANYPLISPAKELRASATVR